MIGRHLTEKELILQMNKETNSRASSADALIDGGGDEEDTSQAEKSEDKNWVKRLSKGAAELTSQLAGLATPKADASASAIVTTTVDKPNLTA